MHNFPGYNSCQNSESLNSQKRLQVHKNWFHVNFEWGRKILKFPQCVERCCFFLLLSVQSSWSSCSSWLMSEWTEKSLQLDPSDLPPPPGVKMRAVFQNQWGCTYYVCSEYYHGIVYDTSSWGIGKNLDEEEKWRISWSSVSHVNIGQAKAFILLCKIGS